MHYSTSYTLYRAGNNLELEVTYNCQSDDRDIPSLEILKINPAVRLSEDEQEELSIHCWSEVSIHLGKALLDELEQSSNPLKIKPVDEAL